MRERIFLSLLLGFVFCQATTTNAASISITSVASTSTCVTANADNGNDDEDNYNPTADACSEPTGGADSNFMRLTDSGATSSSASAPNSTSIDFDIDAGVAVDSAVDGQNEYERGKIRYAFTLQVFASSFESWEVDLGQDVLGLFGFAGDGTATAVLAQNFGNAGITTVDVDVDATDYSFSASPATGQSNTANNGTESFQFSGSRNDSTIASGSGNASYAVTVSFDIDAFSQAGCSTFICSSASGGEDAAVLLGWDDVDDCCGGTVDGISADDYSTWSRAVGPDGYNSSWTLRVTEECGNGSIEGGEGCDDNNTSNNDGCSAACQVEAGYSCTGQPSVCTEFTPTPTPTATDTATPTDTPTPTETATPTDTATPTPTSTPSDTPTEVPTATATDTPLNTNTPTATATATSTPTDASTSTPTNTPTATPTNTPTATNTFVPTATATPKGTCPPTVDASCDDNFLKGLLVVRDRPGAEKVVAKWLRGPTLVQTDMGNPLSPAEGGTGTAYAMCAYDDAGNLAGQLHVERAEEICANAKPCWRALGRAPNDPRGAGRGYKYKDPDLQSDGVSRIIYKARLPSRSRVIFKAKGPNIPTGMAAALQSTTSVTIQIRAHDAMCLSYTANDIKRQFSDLFKAK